MFQIFLTFSDGTWGWGEFQLEKGRGMSNNA